MKRYKLKDLSISKLEYGSGAAACEYNGNTRYVRITDIDSNGKLGEDRVSPNSVDEKYILNDGDVLFARTGATVGKTYRYHNEDGRCLYAGFLIRVIPNQKIIRPDYLYYFTKSPQYNSFIQSSMKVVAQPNINAKQYGDLEFNVPELEVQDEIIEKLSKVLRVIDARKQELSKLDDLIKARFVELFGMPGSNTKGWKTIKLGECCVLNPKKALDKRLSSGLTVSFVPMSAVSENGQIYTSETKEYDEVKTGFTYFSERDVLFAKITPCMENGKGAVAVGLCNDIGFGSTEFHVLRPIEGKSNPYWIYVLTSFDIFRKDAEVNMTGSAGQRRVPVTFFENYKTALPPIELQNEFEAFVEQTDKSKVILLTLLEIRVS